MTDPNFPDYGGFCPETGAYLSLKRTAEAEAAALTLLKSLGHAPEGKMLGVLLTREEVTLRACSGSGPPVDEDWAPSLACSSPREEETLQNLQQITRQLQELRQSSAQAQLAQAEARWSQACQELRRQHEEARNKRQALRQAGAPSWQLDQESRWHKAQKRNLRQQSESELSHLRQRVFQQEQARLQLLKTRRQFSRDLQADLHRRLRLFPFQPWCLTRLFPQAPPTGVGDCCAPKLLHQALLQGLTPEALAEIWWGPANSTENRVQGRFYPACSSRCQPLIGPLLASRRDWLKVIYQDQDLVVVDKPAGVLTVQGRHAWNLDCLEARIRELWPDFRAAHRLDLETSGLLIFAHQHRALSQVQKQFAQRRVKKIYLARLCQSPRQEQGLIELALSPDPWHPGCYRPDPAGKVALTEFRRAGEWVELRPLTGRSHQLRLHALHGLGSPIRGDRLYGAAQTGRLCLHAAEIELLHPTRGTPLRLQCGPPEAGFL